MDHKSTVNVGEKCVCVKVESSEPVQGYNIRLAYDTRMLDKPKRSVPHG